ncbi:MAG: DNA-3-methyladenine glycosylase family protein [Anaerolineales bacterium]
MELYLSARAPFSLTNLIRSHGWVQLLPFESQEPYEHFSYVLELTTGRVCALDVNSSNGGVSITVLEALDGRETSELLDIARWMLDLDLDLNSFYEITRPEPKLAHAEKQGRGRILRSATIFEDVVKTILTTNTAWSGTKRMVRTLVELYGKGLDTDPSLKAFPSAERLADTDVEMLRQDARLGYRAPYILELAQRQASGDLDLEAFKESELPTPELRKELLALKGVGDYAAANLLMLLGRYDTIPVDSWALMMVSKEWHNGQKVTRADVEAAFEPWGDWKGLAFWLWDWNE